MNVRTYVRPAHPGVQIPPGGGGGGGGIYFFSLDATSLLASLGARGIFGLPYHPATMQRGTRVVDQHSEEDRGAAASNGGNRGNRGAAVGGEFNGDDVGGDGAGERGGSGWNCSEKIWRRYSVVSSFESSRWGDRRCGVQAEWEVRLDRSGRTLEQRERDCKRGCNGGGESTRRWRAEVNEQDEEAEEEEGEEEEECDTVKRRRAAGEERRRRERTNEEVNEAVTPGGRAHGLRRAAFLMEKYCLFHCLPTSMTGWCGNMLRGGGGANANTAAVYRANIYHAPWATKPVRLTEGSFRQTIIDPRLVPPGRPPCFVHFGRTGGVEFFNFQRVGRGGLKE